MGSNLRAAGALWGCIGCSRAQVTRGVAAIPPRPRVTHVMRPTPPHRWYSSNGASGTSASDDQHGSQSSSTSSSSSTTPPRASQSPLTPHLQRLQSTLASHRAHYEPKLRSELTRLGQKWNTYSGYDAIERAKQRVIAAEEELSSLRKLQSDARRRYLGTVDQRSVSQKTINDLLQRKASWSDDDLIKYTSLLRSEHSEARSEESAREEFDRAERQVAAAWDNVVKTTLERYHDEQLWSDRVRNVSSYTQLAVVGLNLLVFALAILLVEPYKRRKLAETFERRLVKGEEQGRAALEAVIANFNGTVEGLKGDLRDLKVSQEGLLAVAGVPSKTVAASSVNEEADSRDDAAAPSLDASPPDAPLLDRIRHHTRFLVDPQSQRQRDRRRDVVTATCIGGLATLLGTALIKVIIGG